MEPLDTVDIINVVTGAVSTSPTLLPGPGQGGCAASDGTFVYWVRGTQEGSVGTPEVYRAQGAFCLGMPPKWVA